MDGGWFNIALNTTKTITAFAMQGYGNPGSIDYVMTFMISTSFDNSSWSFVEHSPGVTKIFPGNTDNNGIVTTTFSPPLITRFFRIVAKTCARACAFRLEVYGCEHQLREQI
ncbi:predicted protein [Nematostella vectensis]|uniref:F5/8 type C domain-containing protein n=1 Tax=Nematostella vectensis TaxID=45351 RepID=A7SZZ2_NEMVE|nr:predicted protein [Nematostella vectensis]|eukprot:XP_001622835.1 predicted protein [Nematostella vectensis]